ncbi:glycosyltransferase family 2 protein [Streptomyces stelliscabiei]|uniref:glycosyltransferase family 2 protein n=1 Tax=Streptomyces stelliscabiei TaxID=146820 RepID=UPI0029AE07A5|nr:glycosyltransferase [Streptomyces stelliscabiei]MDX2553237.1 glycosyltransferase [Streptomyces stelliscabiei]MDX2612273.1 glycosyltransferase [Streptomyces stelliscabiei]MDX2637853.1 glycosyltransferase [Streptomyces stelliscabiei]MDX2667608.1 glycosyltransferase [Streptomyces stelliscabiei]MDX2718462.1 glycosyltransferase [Streptomyces stelliscabiei]
MTVVIATQLRPDRLDHLTAMYESLTRQSVPWEAVIALDGADRTRLPTPLAEDSRVCILSLPRQVGAACARNLALGGVRTEFVNWADDDDEFTDDAMAVRLRTLEMTGLGWCAGYSEDLHPDGSASLWRCPTPPGRHEAGDVWTYWTRPEDTIPIGPTTILARTDLVRAAPMGGLVQGEDYMAAIGVTCLAPGILLPVPVYRYRKHPGQMTRQDGYDVLEPGARRHAWNYGRSLRATLSGRETSDAAGVV